MEAATKKYRSFEELDVYRAAREFRKRMYGVARKLPDIERHGLASQIRRAAVSFTNNIAEGHGRFHYLDNIKFVLISRGSLTELVDDLNICEDERYLPPDEIASLRQEADRVLQLINGYIRYLRDQKTGATLQIHEDTAPYGSECTELPE
ncbi:MAG: four helix bundle protein [Verrucomicrobiae bacterium]|nr:four helix bundle protein [Verrucomicrobiae bacterium]